MTLFQADVARIAILLVFYPLMALVFIVLAIKILKRNTTRLNITFSCFYFSIAIGVALNLIYALLQIEAIVLILHYIATYFIGFGLTFLLASNRIILDSALVYSVKIQIRKIMIYALVLAGSFIFIPFNGVLINSSTDWKPIWNLYLYLYITVVQTGFAVIPIIGSSFKILSKMTEKQIRRRWILLILGTIGLLISMYLTFLANFLNNNFIRQISTFYAITIVIWVLLIYRGIGKQL